MMGAKLDAEKVLADLKGMAARAAHPKQFYATSKAVLHRDVMAHFSAEEGPEGAWKDWSPGTVKARQRGRGGSKILQGSGIMRGSIRPESQEKNARVFTNLIYAGVHNRGFPGPDSLGRMLNIPKREFMWLSQAGLRTLEQMGLRFLRDGTT